MNYAYRAGDWEAALARGSFKVEWKGAGRKAQCAPDPAFPEGVVSDCSSESKAWCAAAVPYPAPECGLYIVECKKCGVRVGATAAGRPDDPRVLVVACRGGRTGL